MTAREIGVRRRASPAPSWGNTGKVTPRAAWASSQEVHAIRHLLAQRHLAVLICAATLLLKLLVPTGYMIDSDHGRIAITICSGTGPATMAMEMPGMHGDMPDHGKSKDHGKAEMPCAFSGLSAAMTGAIDPIPARCTHRVRPRDRNVANRPADTGTADLSAPAAAWTARLPLTDRRCPKWAAHAS